MRRISSGNIGIDQGNTSLFSHFEAGESMWTGKGPREIRKRIDFDERFRTPPNVHLSLALIDLDAETNPRADLAAEHVDERGFEAVFRTWADTRVARIRVSWLAIGAVSSDGDWDVT
ncbi:MAG: H-type lectin domain-containing protein [Marinovum sp.]|nr:H-type lectin domain-containing protein [Marinovum sp.]